MDYLTQRQAVKKWKKMEKLSSKNVSAVTIKKLFSIKNIDASGMSRIINAISPPPTQQKGCPEKGN